VIGYGAGTATVTTSPLNFGTVVVGQTKTLTATITANQNLTIPAGGLTSSSGLFTLGTPTPGLPATLAANGTLMVPVTFAPTAAGAASGSINVTVSGGGGGSVTLSGTGQVNAAQLTASPAMLSFGGVATGTTKSLTVLLQNTGNQTLTFSGFTAPAAPYSVTGVPASGATLAAGASVTATVTYAPTAAGTFNSNLVVNSNGGNVTIPAVGTAGAPPQMVITPLSINFGTTGSGVPVTKTFTIKNTGGTDLQITKSKPPALGPFVATTTLAEGSTITAGQTVTESVTFSATAGGSYSDVWVITGNDTSGVQNVAFSGTVAAALSRTGWVASASNSNPPDVPANALDGNLGSRWTTGVVMAAGMWFQVDMGTAQSVNQIVMNSNGSGDYARAYSVYVTNDTTNLGNPVAQGTATADPITVPFAAATGRYIRVVLGTIPAGTTAWWSIHEFNAYGSGGSGTGAAGSTGAAGTTGSAGASGALLINSGGPAVAPYLADVDFSTSVTINHANTIDVSGVTNPAPAAVYQTARIGTFTYTIPGFVAGSSHTVRLHMCETFHTGAGQRTFNVTINNTQVLTAFDIYAATGAMNKAIVKPFTSTANASGQYVITFTTVVDNSLISAIEID
jgi:Malectin domain/F5/8 type C domain/Abnormal spindle-like microcephaly-assoc'd, ASPM-SPD-2-Hydin